MLSAWFVAIVGLVVTVLVGVVTLSDSVELIPVGSDAEDLILDTDSDVDVLIALVEAPTTAAPRVKTVVAVLQHLCLSASLSQQYFASSPYPCFRTATLARHLYGSLTRSSS